MRDWLVDYLMGDVEPPFGPLEPPLNGGWLDQAADAPDQVVGVPRYRLERLRDELDRWVCSGPPRRRRS